MRYRRTLLGLASLGLLVGPAVAGVTRLPMPAGKDGKLARILEGVELSAGTTTLYLSGQVASPIDTDRLATTNADYGDTETQTASVLWKIKAILNKHGYRMSDVFKMTIFLVADSRTSKMDLAGANKAFDAFFGVADNANTVARSAVQVSALANPAFLVEIEVIAAK